MGDLKNINLDDLELDAKVEIEEVDGGANTSIYSVVGGVANLTGFAGKFFTTPVNVACKIIKELQTKGNCTVACTAQNKQTHYSVCRSQGPCWQ